jgi:tetratricopeptide (TPR) repeat protein
MSVRFGSLVAAAAVLALVGPAKADSVQLKDGRFVDGLPLQVAGQEVVVKYKNGDVRVPLSMIETYFIEGQSPPIPDTDEARAKAALGLVPWKGKWVKPAERDKMIKDEVAKRRAEIEDAKKHSLWRNRYMFQSKDFSFESTMPPTLNQYYSQFLDAYYEAFKKDWNLGPLPKGFDPKLKVCFYPTLEDFEKIGGAHGALAYYRFVAPRELNFFNKRTDRRLTEMVMFHECTHYLVDLLGDGKVDYPHCIGEAMAEYYGGTAYDPVAKTMKIGGIQEGRLAEVKSDVDAGNMFPLEKFFATEGGQYEDYYWGWSFFHFLMSTPAYQKKFKSFVTDLARAKDVRREPRGDVAGLTVIKPAEYTRVFKDRMGIKELGPLEKEWHDYVRKLEPASVRGYEAAGKRAFQDGRVKFRAPRLLKKAIEMGSKDPETLTAYASCLRMKGEHEEALKVVDQAIALDPLDAELWADRSYLLRAKGDKEEADKTFALAKEMDPDANFIDFGAIQGALNGAGDDGK